MTKKRKKPKAPPKQRNPFVQHLRFKRQGAHKRERRDKQKHKENYEGDLEE